MAFLSLAPPVPVTGSGVFGDDGVTHKQNFNLILASD